ncbi:MAG TPA: sugar ABC transporter permease, partial [Chloroflexia bacterium]|nr:sugar ABC transporter permease [Chloroflexia bacterium]
MASIRGQAQTVSPVAKPHLRRNSLGQRMRRSIPAYLFILPGMALFVIWTLYPLLHSLTMSFAEWNLIKPSRFVGAENYTRAFSDPVFWLAL